MPEAAGVGRDAEVQVRRDLLRPRHAQRVDDVGHHFRARDGAAVEPVLVAVHRVAQVVIDVDDEVRLEPVEPGPREVAALERDDGIGGAVDARGDLDAVDAGEVDGTAQAPGRD